jgi:hypothetical protein
MECLNNVCLSYLLEHRCRWLCHLCRRLAQALLRQVLLLSTMLANGIHDLIIPAPLLLFFLVLANHKQWHHLP